MSTMHEVPGGRVEIREAHEVTERHARRVRALQMKMATVPSVKEAAKKAQAAEKAARAAGIEFDPESLEDEIDDDVLDALPIMQELEDATIMAKVKSWSFNGDDGEPLPVTVDALLDLPAPAYAEIKKLCASVVGEVSVDTEPTPDPNTPTEPSTV